MRQRQTFRATAWESLEGRELLSRMFGFLDHIGHHSAHHQNRATVGAYGRSGPNHGLRGRGAPGPGGPLGANQAALNRNALPPSQLTSQTNSDAPYAGLRAGGGTLKYDSLVRGLKQNDPSTQTDRLGLSPLPTTSPYNPALPGTSNPQPTIASSSTSPLPSSTPAGASASPIALTTSPVEASAPLLGGPMKPRTSMQPPLGMLNGLNLSKADVLGLRQSVDDFSTRFTSGQNTVKDKDAVDRLKAGLDDLAQSVWSESHVAARGDVVAFQKAANDFATSYTSNANLAQDKAAWQALHDALDRFGASLKTPGLPDPEPFPSLAAHRLLSTPQAGVSNLVGSLLTGPALASDEVDRLRSTVDTFADSYTNGNDLARDKDAVKALETGMSSLLSSHWAKSNITPIPVPSETLPTPAAPPTTTAQPGTLAISAQPFQATTLYKAGTSDPAVTPGALPSGKG
ncbi:MAG: hypothetical protein NVSMB9_10280 [Isosphaeraceae bacterium]